MRMEDVRNVAAVETSDSGEPEVKSLPVDHGDKMSEAVVSTVCHIVLSQWKSG